MYSTKILASLALSLLLSACSESTPVKENSSNNFDSKQLSGEWWLQSSLSNNDQQWARQKSTTPRRFNARMSFQLPSRFETTVLHPADRHYSAIGTFSVRENVVSTEYRLSSSNMEPAARRNRLVEKRFIVLKINDTDMVVRPVPIQN